MKNLNRYTVTLIFILMIHVVGCATTTAPRGWLPSPSVVQHEGFGGWISVEYTTGDLKSKADGELIAINSNQLFILTTQELVSIPTNSITRMKLTAYNAQSGRVAGWTILGTLSTLSHGAYLILSAPTWLIGGCIATSVKSHEPQVTHPPKSLEEFRAYARFPQGVPEGIDMQSLRLKN